VDRTLTDFIRALRHSDVRVSTSETMDAFRAVRLVGYEEREQLKSALSMTLAKSEEEKARLGDVFDRFFRFDAFSDEPETDDDAAAGDNGEGDGQEFSPEDWDGESTELARMLLENDTEALALTLQEAAQDVNVANINFFIQRGIFTRRIMEQMGLAGLDAEIAGLSGQEGGAAQARMQALTQARERLFEQTRDFVERQIGLYASTTGRRLREDLLRNIKLTNVDLQDFRLMKELVHKMAKRLASLHSRRRKITRRGHLDVRRTLRANMPYDGVLIDPKWKVRRVERPSVYAICDVSGSVASVARFLLMFLYSLQDVLPRVRAFAFSNRLAEMTETLKNMPLEEAINKVLKEQGYGTTDYGQAFVDFKELAMEDIDHRSTVIILGDARSNFLNPRADILKEVYRRAKWVMLLNPEPRSFWDTGDSEMTALRAGCHQAEVCNTMSHLERVIDNILRMAT